MFWTKWIAFVLSLIMLFVARKIYEEHYNKPTMLSNVIAVIAAVLGIVFCVLMAVMHWNVMIIPKIALYISICLYVLFKEEFEICGQFLIGFIITAVIWVGAGIVYIGHLEQPNAPDVSTTRCNMLCAKDGTMTSGNMSGFLIYVQASSTEKSVYKYYYQLEDGGIKLGEVSAKDATIYFLRDGEAPYIETVVTTTYFMNNNNNPATRCLENSSVTYKLYVPEGSITNVYEFDAE